MFINYPGNSEDCHWTENTPLFRTQVYSGKSPWRPDRYPTWGRSRNEMVYRRIRIFVYKKLLFFCIRAKTYWFNFHDV